MAILLHDGLHGPTRHRSAMSFLKILPDAGDSAHIPSSFSRLIFFLAGRLRRPRPSAGNAIRWAT
ncbi:MAG: hypothetical protein IPP66_17730 [Anaerolineales bacterium]|nr:hypothetical protein [Anaerolineales bacterium]